MYRFSARKPGFPVCNLKKICKPALSQRRNNRKKPQTKLGFEVSELRSFACLPLGGGGEGSGAWGCSRAGIQGLVMLAKPEKPGFQVSQPKKNL